MIELTGRATISDRMLLSAVDKSYMEDAIQRQISSSFAKALVEQEEFQKNIVKREPRIDLYNPYGETIYETTMVLLTPNEAKEFRELKRFQKEMKNFIL